MSYKNVYTKERSRINTIDEDTGEIKKELITRTKVDDNYRIIDSVEYIIIDSDAIRYLESVLSVADMSKVYRMCNMVNGCYNILCNGTTPHTKETLMGDLAYSRSKFSSMLTRLLKQSVIYYLEGYKAGKKVKHIMLNPTLARKSKKFHKDCTSVFDDLSKMTLK